MYSEKTEYNQDINDPRGLKSGCITPASTEAKPFLRRGSGLARYGGISGTPKGVVRRKSKSSGSPFGQMKRSTSTSTMTPARADKTEEKSRRVSTADGRMKQSSSCSKISDAITSYSNKKSSVRQYSVKSPNKIGSKANRIPPKTLKLKSVKKQLDAEDYAGSTSESYKGTSNQPSQRRVSTIVSNDQEPIRLTDEKRHGLEIPNTSKAINGISSSAFPEPAATLKILNSMASIGAYDSVELSFMEKLDKANKNHSKELEDLAAFEMLEDKLATTDSSICSSISAIKIQQNSIPDKPSQTGNSPSLSPIASRRRPYGNAGSATSTPMANKLSTDNNSGNISRTGHRTRDAMKNMHLLDDSAILQEEINYNQDNEYSDESGLLELENKDVNLPDPVINHNLMRDIKNFLALNKGHQEGNSLEIRKETTNDHDTEEDDTLKDDAIDGIPSDEDVVNVDTKCTKRIKNYQPLPKNGTNNVYVNEQIIDNSYDDEMNGNDINTKAKNVRFQEKLEKEKYQALTFSPPRIPKSSPSYLIWSIFTKEREERNRQKAKSGNRMDEADEEWLDIEDGQEMPTNKLAASRSRSSNIKKDITSKNCKNDIDKKDPSRRRRRSDSPMSRISSKKNLFEMDHNDTAFQDALLNAKLVELNKEVEEFKKENISLQTNRRRLTADRKQLAKDIDEFERSKENDKKKLEEERKRLRREKTMFEKSQKEKRSTNDRKAQDEIEELQAKLNKLNDELNRKETKWALALSKLQEQVKFLERENQQLHEDNHKLKLKGVSAKVSSHLVDPSTRRVYSASNSMKGTDSCKNSSNQLFHNSGIPLPEAPSRRSIDNGIQPESVSSKSPSNNDELDITEFNNCNNLCNGDELDERQLMAFSPAESLESNVTLVSAGMSDPTSIKAARTTVSTEPNGTTLNNASPSLSQTNRSQATYKVRSENCNINGDKVNSNSVKKVEKVEKSNDKVVKYYTDGSIEICCTNGHRKEISADGKTTKVFYNNGDIKETLPSGLVKYFYSGVKTWHFKYEDGREVTQFNNGKTETKFPDGTIVIDEANGDSIILLPNGQKEEHTSQYKVNELKYL